MKKIFLFFLLTFFASAAYCQNQSRIIDSINHALETAAEDTVKVHELNNLSKIYWQIGDFDKALKYGQECLALSQKIGFKAGIANAFTKISLAYGQMGNYPESLKSSLASLKMEEQLGDKKGIANCYNNIGNIYFKIGNEPEGAKNYNIALKIREQIGDKEGLATSYNNLGNFYTHRNNFPEALKNYSASVKIAEQIGDKEGLCRAYNNMGNVYRSEKEYKKTMEFYALSLNIALETGNKYAIASSYINLGEVYTNIKNYEQGKDYFNKGLLLAREVGSKDEMAVCCIGLAELDSLTGKYSDAYHYFHLYTSLHDSIFNQESNKQISQLRIQYETEKREKEMATLKVQNELETQKAKQRNTYILLITSLSLLILSLLWFQSYKRKKKLIISDKELEKKNLELKNKDLFVEKKKAEERAKVQREIAEQYHDVLGSKITSLLFMCENEKTAHHNGNHDVEEFTSKVSGKLKEIAETNRSGIIALDPETEELDSFIPKLRSDLYDLIETAGKEVLFQVPAHIPAIRIEPIVKFNLSALLKEAINNAIKYSKTNEITIKIELTGTQYIISIIDHGVGIDLDKKRNTSYGMLNMIHRMDTIGGTCQVISKVNEGTTVKLAGDFIFSTQLNEVN